MYTFESIVRYSEIDEYGKMTVPAVLETLQDCCTFQSEHLGLGLAWLKEHHRAWVLSSWQVVFVRFPQMGERIATSTWAYDFKNFFGYRNFKIEDEAGHVIVYANSVWAYLDTESGRPVRIPQEVAERYSLEEPFPMEHAPRKLKCPENMQAGEPIRVGHFFIDTNRHVNNSKYVMMAEEYLPEKANVRELRVEYKKAAVLMDEIYPGHLEEDGKVFVSMEDKDGKPYAVAEFLLD